MAMQFSVTRTLRLTLLSACCWAMTGCGQTGELRLPDAQDESAARPPAQTPHQHQQTDVEKN